MNRARICPNRQLNVIHRNGCQRHTCPKLEEILPPTLISNTVDSIVHIQIAIGNIPMDVKNINGNRRLIVFLFVGIGITKGLVDFQDNLTILWQPLVCIALRVAKSPSSPAQS